MNEDSYAINARYYDAGYAAKTDLVDLPFYVEEARRSGGPVLEIGCGTGRVTREIARLGMDVVGVDPSPSMLAVFRNHLADGDRALASRVELIEGDLRTLDLGRTFPLVILPFRVLQHIDPVSDQIRAFRAIRRHLSPDGMAIFDVFFPRFERVYGDVGKEIPDFQWTLPNGHTVTRLFIKDRFDKVEQSFEARFIYRTMDGEKQIREEEAGLKMVSYTPPQLRLLLHLAGLVEVDSFGHFDRSPLDNEASEIIFKVRPAIDSGVPTDEDAQRI